MATSKDFKMAINQAAAEDAAEAENAGLPASIVRAIAGNPMPSMRASLMRTGQSYVPAAQSVVEARADIGGGQSPLLPTQSATKNGCDGGNIAGARDNLPGIVWTDVASLSAYDGPYEYYESRMGFYASQLSSGPTQFAFQGRTRVQNTTSPLDIAAAQTAATRAAPVGFRIEFTVPGDSAPSMGTFALVYVDAQNVSRTLNFSAIGIAGRCGIIRILPGLTSIFGRPARHTPFVNNALVVTSLGLLAPATVTTLTFSGLPANTPVAVELIQPGSPTYLEDLRAIVTAP